MSQARAGRPKASSRETLAEAACELFLERGYAATSVGDIAARAGVSRSSFFNYFAAKGDILWAALDERIAQAIVRLGRHDMPVDRALAGIVHGFAPDSLALAIANAAAMGVEDELQRERAIRQWRLGAAVADVLRADGEDAVASQIRGAAAAAAVFAAVWSWAGSGAGTTSLGDILDRALRVALVSHAGMVCGPRGRRIALT